MAQALKPPTLHPSFFPVSRQPPPARVRVKAKAPEKARERAPEKEPEKEPVKHQYRRLRLPMTASVLPMERVSSDMSLPQHAVSAVTTPMDRDRSRENNSINITTDLSVNGPLQPRSIPLRQLRTWRHQQRRQQRD